MAANTKKTVEQEALATNDSVEKIKGLWEKSGKTISLILGVLIVAIGGFFAYQQFVTKPKNSRSAG